MSKVYRVLVGCERSGMVRDAFLARGFDAVSCDLEPSDRPGPHIRGDVLEVLADGWDLGIFFPPCRFLASSGARWFSSRKRQQNQSVAFVKRLAGCKIPKRAIENPVGVLSTRLRKPDQYIQPWMFGHGETKKTCLWLWGLPPLQPTKVVPGRVQRIAWMSPSVDRPYLRSITYPGVAEAMALQWGDACRNCAAPDN